jgi:hypothetical protein
MHCVQTLFMTIHDNHLTLSIPKDTEMGTIALPIRLCYTVNRHGKPLAMFDTRRHDPR